MISRFRLHSLVVNSVAGRFAVPNGARVEIYRRLDIEVGPDTHIASRQTIRQGHLSFGSRCFVNYGGMFDPGQAAITVEDDVFLGMAVALIAQTHEVGPSTKRAGRLTSADVRIGRGSWLGARVTVVPGVTVAPGCVVGAGAVVTRDTEPDGLYAGVPARLVRRLSED